MPPNGELLVYADPAALARALADVFLATGRMAIEQRGVFRVALSGGNTPRAAYELLARQTPGAQLSWPSVYVYFGDERCVPPEDERSNYRMARQAFLDAVNIPPENVRRIRGELDPAAAAAQYAAQLRADMGDGPQFDLVMLGLGPDGHTASLFPGTPPDADDDALVRAVYAQSQAMWRVTITPKVINAGRTVAFAAEGSEKAAIFAAVYEGPLDPVRYPAQIVRPQSGRLLWLLDKDAAAMLGEKTR